MGARISVKALVLEKGRLLLNVCEDETNGVYYTLPGGGQNLYEPLEEALVREVLEETGYSVYPERLAGVYEEIFTDPLLQQNYPDYSHRIYPVFFCKLRHLPQITPTEKDYAQKSCTWIPLNQLPALKVLPEVLSKNISSLILGKSACFLGTEFSKHSHG